MKGQYLPVEDKCGCILTLKHLDSGCRQCEARATEISRHVAAKYATIGNAHNAHKERMGCEHERTTRAMRECARYERYVR